MDRQITTQILSNMLADSATRVAILVGQVVQEKDYTMGCKGEDGEREMEKAGQEEEVRAHHQALV